MPFLFKSWYVAAFAEEIPSGATLGRRLLGESLVFFRTEAGQITALQNRCPHRFAPLAAGKVKGSAIECAYHGLRFGRDGVCVHNPHGNGAIPAKARVRSFPAMERDGFVWVWMGDPELADPATIPDYSSVSGNPPTAVVNGYLRTEANYELMTDNIMDLSHADFLHPGSLATWSEVTKLRPEVSEIDGGIHVSWAWGPADPPPVFAPLLPAGARCDVSLQVTWRAAANMRIRFNCRQVGAEHAFEVGGCHLMTPEDEDSTHYFFLGTRNYLMEDAEFNRMTREFIMRVFTQEDKPIIEAVQRSMQTSDLWSLNPVMLSADAGGVRVRRKLSALMGSQ